MSPQKTQNSIFIAERGFWNRCVPIGYRIRRVVIEKVHSAVYRVSAEGSLQGTQVWGRPVDLRVMPDGSLLVSDDRAGAVYRIDYRS